ncbi:MAG: alkaline phosphatase family protein [Lachnoclostridium sp.]|nr:alkaline phosphatase family protein [Lachnoclostridium sp.]
MQQRNPSNIASRIVSILVASMAVISASAASPVAAVPSRPSLVINIVVEGLDGDYVELLRNHFGSGGFNRLIADGVTIDNIDYGPGLDAQAATALLVSGASPSVTGVPSAMVYQADTKGEKPILASSMKPLSYSPAGMLVSTLSDEIRITDDGLNQVHSIAADPQVAILLAGHAANSAFWIDDVNGKWTSSSYYKETPTVISRRNFAAPLSLRIDTMAWTPAMDLSLYPDLPEHKKIYPFRHSFTKRDPDVYKAFKSSACGNREVANVAVEYIEELGLGKHGVTDMINIGFTVAPYIYGRVADNRIETMDAYLRLDSDLARIMRAADSTAGEGNSLIFISGTPAPASRKKDDEKWGIPSGKFSPTKAVSLLNMYLIALHGNGEYVSAFHNGYFYLNHNLLKERGLDASEMRKKAAEFLMRMSGVSRVYTIDDIIARDAGDNPVALRRNTSLSHAGDLLVAVNPGWVITDCDDEEVDAATATHDTTVSFTSTLAPVWIIAPGIAPHTIGEVVDARAIAPTVSRILRIRSPNAASVPPLNLK